MEHCIVIREFYENSFSSETYVGVQFHMQEQIYWIPISGHRYNFDYNSSNISAIKEYLYTIAPYFEPEAITDWYTNIENIYSDLLSKTEMIFLKELTTQYGICRHCSQVYIDNPNAQAVIKQLKDKGFYIASLQVSCPKAKRKKTYDYLLPIPPSELTQRTEKIPEETKQQMIQIYKGINSYTNTTDKSILPDHRFPEIRWGANPVISDNKNLSDEEVVKKFQPLNNKFNLMKKEACKKCYASDIRQYPYGIKFFYYGEEKWNESIPKDGPEAEKGCVGCGWYDLIKWKEEMNKKINGED